jgi:hypothetical protein
MWLAEAPFQRPWSRPGAKWQPTNLSLQERYPSPCSARPSSNRRLQMAFDNQTSIPSNPPPAHAYEGSPLLLPQLRSPKSFFSSLQSCRAVSRFRAGFSKTSPGGRFIEADRKPTPICDHVTWISGSALASFTWLPCFCRPPWALSTVPQTSSERPDKPLCHHPP